MTTSVPKSLPFHTEGFGWDVFERFCLTWLVADAALPNLGMTGTMEASRLRVLDAQRVGSSGEKQHGIDLLLTMENRATWVIQCKHVQSFGKHDFERAIAKAKSEFGSYQPSHYLIWVTGKVTAPATLHAHSKPDCTLWSAERMTAELLVNTPQGKCRRVIEMCFGPAVAKTFFPAGDELLITETEFFARWEGEGRSFHHRAEFAGRAKELAQLVTFASGGKGHKALILPAAGGVGKTRLLREVARQAEALHPARCVRFINPQASREALMPTFEETSATTIIHDDAHRMDMPTQVLGCMHRKEIAGIRLILATRPGAEAGLRELLMRSGMEAADITILPGLKKLSLPEMTSLASSILGTDDDKLARTVASISDGCALITLVGCELLRQGRLRNLDLVQSDDFRSQVLDHFAKREMDQAAEILPKPTLQRLLNTIALLSPWPAHEVASMEKIVAFLNLPRSGIEAALDQLQQAGLLVHTHKGLRISPDLFSDHLAYRACYDEQGRSTDFLRQFLVVFVPEESSRIMQNLAEAEWRASRMHKDRAEGIFEAVWHPFLEAFEHASFWERGQMIEKWAGFALYQQDRSIELARWALDLKEAPSGNSGYESLNNFNQVLHRLPQLLKPIAIWSDYHRTEALDMLLMACKERLLIGEQNHKGPYADLAEIASFQTNFPAASTGVLDWLEIKLNGPEATELIDRPCEFLRVLLGHYFASAIEETFMSDRRTFTIQTIGLSVVKTRPLRERVLKLIRETIFPRGSIAIVNVIPLLIEASRGSISRAQLPTAHDRAWATEYLKVLELLAEVAKLSSHTLVHYLVRQKIRLFIVHGKNEARARICREIWESLQDSLELRIARLTLSYYHDDGLDPWDEKNSQRCLDNAKNQWNELRIQTVADLLGRGPTCEALRDYLEVQMSEMLRHGFNPHYGDIWREIYLQKPALGLQVLESIVNKSQSPLSRDVCQMLFAAGNDAPPEVDEIVRRGLTSNSVDILCGLIHGIRFTKRLKSPEIIAALMELTNRREISVLRALLSIIADSDQEEWSDTLGHRLFDQELEHSFILEMSAELSRAEEYHEHKPSESLIRRLVGKLVSVPRLPNSYGGHGGIISLASSYPRLVYDLLRQRVQLQELETAIEAIPYGDELMLRALEKEPDFESIASDLLDAVLSRSQAKRYLWQDLFIKTVGHAGSMVEKLLLSRLPSIQSEADLSVLCDLLGFEGSLIPYTQPVLIESILEKAATFGPKAFDSIRWELIHAAQPRMRGYTNGVTNEEHAYALPAAEEALKRNPSNPRLRAFYQKIIEVEKAEAERIRKSADDSFPDEWAE